MKYLSVTLALLLAFGITLSACSGKAETPQAAIEKAQTMAPEKAADYLLGQADAFYKAKQYKEALQLVNKAQSDFNANADKANQMITKIKDDMAAAAKEAAAEAKKKLGLGG